MQTAENCACTWIDLPQTLLVLIFQRGIKARQLYSSLHLVCHSWRSAAIIASTALTLEIHHRPKAKSLASWLLKRGSTLKSLDLHLFALPSRQQQSTAALLWSEVSTLVLTSLTLRSLPLPTNPALPETLLHLTLSGITWPRPSNPKQLQAAASMLTTLRSLKSLTITNDETSQFPGPCLLSLSLLPHLTSLHIQAALLHNTSPLQTLPPNLRTLNLSWNSDLQTIPRLHHVPHLQALNLDYIHPEPQLPLLDLAGLTNLTLLSVNKLHTSSPFVSDPASIYIPSQQQLLHHIQQQQQQNAQQLHHSQQQQQQQPQDAQLLQQQQQQQPQNAQQRLQPQQLPQLQLHVQELQLQQPQHAQQQQQQQLHRGMQQQGRQLQLQQPQQLSTASSSTSRFRFQGMVGDDCTAAWCGLHLTTLRSLSLRGYCLSDSGVSALTPLVYLTELQLSGFTPQGLEQLPHALPHLKTLRYQDTYPPPPASLGAKALLMKHPQGFRVLAQMQNLCHLDTGESHQPGALALLSQQLTSLRLRVQEGGSFRGGNAARCGRASAGAAASGARAGSIGSSTSTEQYERVVFAALLQLRELQELTIEGMRLGKGHLQQLGRSLTGLGSLDVQGCGMGGDWWDGAEVAGVLLGLRTLRGVRWPNAMGDKVKGFELQVLREALGVWHEPSEQMDKIQV